MGTNEPTLHITKDDLDFKCPRNMIDKRGLMSQKHVCTSKGEWTPGITDCNGKYVQ